MPKQIIKRLHRVFPPLRNDSKKGQNGRVGVIGGSFQFTGAPFYSAISALKIGGDLGHIFCSKSSAPSIKSYSPQIIVHPVFVSEQQLRIPYNQVTKIHEEWFTKVNAWDKAINSWVIGPGLGRDVYMHTFFPSLVKKLPQNSLVTFDADGIFYLSQYPQLYHSLRRHRAILSPNWKQLQLIRKDIDLPVQKLLKNNALREGQQVREIDYNTEHLGFSLLIKGQHDLILGRKKSFIVGTEGGLKRCGGVGDILAGCSAVTSFWDFDYGLALASRIVRLATKAAFLKQGRGLTAPCIVKELASTVAYLDKQFADGND